MARRLRKTPLKQLAVCPACASYMKPHSAIEAQAVGGRHWKDETFHRSFGGNEIREFVCEKCGHSETYQIDNLGYIEPDP